MARARCVVAEAEIALVSRDLSWPANALDAAWATLEDVEALLASTACVVDACRHVVRHDSKVISLATRPVLFALAGALGEAGVRMVTMSA